MAGCNTGRNIQKYKGAGASTLQDALENSNVATLDINLISGAVYIGDGGGLSNINASAVAGNLQAVTDNSATTTNKITLTNGVTSLETTGNVLITGNVTAGNFLGDGGTLSNIAASKDFQEVTDLGATSSNKITLTNSVTSLETSGKIVSLTLEANVNASNIVTADGRGINQLNASNVSIGTLSIARGGTGSGSASTAASALGVGTEDSPQFTAIELGHASDTTLARSGPGKVTIEGDEIRTGTVPIAKGGTGVTSASAAATALGVGTGNSPQFTAIQLGHASDTTLARSGPGKITIEGQEIRTGTVPVSKGGTGATTLDNLITMGAHTTGNYVASITGGDGITAGGAAEGGTPSISLDLKENHGLVIDNTELKIDLKSSGGLEFNGGQMRVKIDDSGINGVLPVAKGGTGTNNLNNLITMGTHTTGNYVQTITGGDGITSTGATSGENIAHSLSVDTKANGGLVFESNKLAVKLDHNNITGKLAVGDGGTGHDSYTIGQLLVADSTSSLTKLTPGTSGYFLKSNGAGSPLVWSNVAAVGSSTPAALSAGSFLVGGPFNGASAATFNVQGDNANIANKLVARDASGDIRVEEVIVGTGTTGSLTSTAWSGSAARLTNARTIGGVSFNGTADINLPGVNVTGNQNTSGSAARLTNARTIGGVSFNGSADINLPGVNQAGNQNTSGNAATATKLAASVSIGGVLFDGSASITPSSIANASDTSTSTDQNVAFLVGNNIKTNTNLTINPSTAELKATKFTAGTNGFVDTTFINNGVIYANTNKKLVSTTVGSDGQVLTLASGLPTWATPSSSGGSYWTQNGSIVYYNSGNVGISNAAPTHTLDIGSNVSVIDDGVDKLVIRGNVYSTNDIISLGTVHTDILKAKDAFIKNTTVVAERPTRQVRLN